MNLVMRGSKEAENLVKIKLRFIRARFLYPSDELIIKLKVR